VIIEYVVIRIPQPIGLSLASEVNLQIMLSSAENKLLSFEYPMTQFTSLLSFTHTHVHVCSTSILANGNWKKLFDLHNKLMLTIPVDHILNCCFHCSTDTPELHSTKARLRTVQQAVTPTKLFPAPAHNIQTHHCQAYSIRTLCSERTIHQESSGKSSYRTLQSHHFDTYHKEEQ
jgi:hypothetical protein